MTQRTSMNQAKLIVRFTALLLIWAGVLLLLRNLALSYESFRPSYFGHYFRQELLTPALLLGAGLLMRLRSQAICRRLIRDEDRD